MKTLAIIQARCSSSRLPNKVLKSIVGKPMIQLQLERVLRAGSFDGLILATSMAVSDNRLEDLIKELGIKCFRGDLNDVLDRFYRAAKLHAPEYVVRLTGDCPLADPKLIDDVVAYCRDGGYDYASNALEPTFPDGHDVEVIKMSALSKAWSDADLLSEREHVTPFIYNRPHLFKIGSYKGKKDLSELRWTVDNPDDFEFVKKVYEGLYRDNPKFDTDDILAYLDDNPSLKTINSHHMRNEGLKLSKAKDHVIEKRKITRSIGMQNRAKKLIPGMTQLLSKRPDQFSLGVWPSYFKRAEGATVWDLDDNEYIDMSIGGIGANILGYCDPDVDSAVIDAIRRGNSSSLNCQEEVLLAELLCEIHPWAEMVRYARTGGEAMTIAVRLARAATGRDKVAVCGYHGWHDWYLAANLSDEKALDGHLLPGLEPAGVPRCLKGSVVTFNYNNFESFEDLISSYGDELAAVIMEPIRNDDPKEGFLQSVKDVCGRIGAVFIFDEISAGFRLNSAGAHMQLGVEPDIAVFSKSIGNGYPMAAIIGRMDVMSAAQKSFISSTYWTERTGPAAAIATLNKHRKMNVSERLVKVGRAIQEGWRDAASLNGLNIEIGGIPPLSHFSFKCDDSQAVKAYFIQLMLERGYLASTSFYSMFSHEKSHVGGYINALNEVFCLIAEAVRNGDVHGRLDGEPSAEGFARLL